MELQHQSLIEKHFAIWSERDINKRAVARLFWQFGTADMPAQETGQDVFVVENGKISRLLIFIDVR